MGRFNVIIVLFVVFALIGSVSGTIEPDLAASIELMIIPFITVAYLFKVRNKSLLFSLFLITYSVSNFINCYDIYSFSEIFYFVCNGLYVLAYLFLLAEIVKRIKIVKVLRDNPIHTVVLALLNAYIIYILITIVNPILFDTNHIDYVLLLEHVYNIILLALLSISFFNYLENDDKKSLLLFWGCLAVSFGEFLLIGYYYLSQLEVINVVASSLHIIAFLLFYFQADNKIEEETRILV